MYTTEFILTIQKWSVACNGVTVRLFSTYEAAQRYADNKNNEAR